MHLLSAKCKAREIAVQVQRKFNFIVHDVPKVFKNGRRGCCVPRTDSFSFSETIVHTEDQRRLDQIARANMVALKVVTKGKVSQQQLRDRLKERGIVDVEIVQRTVEQMAEMQLQSDLEFAIAFIDTKWNEEKWSLKKMELELKHRHCMSDKMIFKALRYSFINLNDEEFENEYYLHELLRRIQSRVDGQLSHLDVSTKKQRISSWLMRHHHSFGTVHRVMKEIYWKTSVQR